MRGLSGITVEEDSEVSNENTNGNNGIYVVNCCEWYKIGMTNSITNRMSVLQTGCPFLLELVAFVSCENDTHSYKLEQHLHNIYKNKRGIGEWFKLEKRDISEIILEGKLFVPDDTPIHCAEQENPRAEPTHHITIEDEIAIIKKRREYYLNRVKNADTHEKWGHQEIRIEEDEDRDEDNKEDEMVKAIGSSEFKKYQKNKEPLSRTNAILAKCYDCMGGYVDGKLDCIIDECPLYPFMPYKNMIEIKATTEPLATTAEA